MNYTGVLQLAVLVVYFLEDLLSGHPTQLLLSWLTAQSSVQKIFEANFFFSSRAKCMDINVRTCNVQLMEIAIFTNSVYMCVCVIIDYNTIDVAKLNHRIETIFSLNAQKISDLVTFCL